VDRSCATRITPVPLAAIEQISLTTCAVCLTQSGDAMASDGVVPESMVILVETKG
jgi:hypothetical protein